MGKNHFGKTDLIINAHMNNLLNLDHVKNSSNFHALRIYVTCEVKIRNLNNLGVNSTSFDHLLTPILLKVLPHKLVIEFNGKCGEKIILI